MIVPGFFFLLVHHETFGCTLRHFLRLRFMLSVCLHNPPQQRLQRHVPLSQLYEIVLLDGGIIHGSSSLLESCFSEA